MNEKEALLNQLRDVEVPQVSSVPALGWWLLLLLVIFAIVAAWVFYRRWRARLWQRQALEQLQNIRALVGNAPDGTVLSECSQLARKVVLAADHREQVAALHGEPWLEKLDDVCGRPEFSQGAGRLLLDQPYQRQPVLGEQDFIALFDSFETLIGAAAKYRSTDQAMWNRAPDRKQSA